MDLNGYVKKLSLNIFQNKNLFLYKVTHTIGKGERGVNCFPLSLTFTLEEGFLSNKDKKVSISFFHLMGKNKFVIYGFLFFVFGLR